MNYVHQHNVSILYTYIDSYTSEKVTPWLVGTYITSKLHWKGQRGSSLVDLGPCLDTRECSNQNIQLLVQNTLPLYIPYTWYRLRCWSGYLDFDVCWADDRTSRTWRPLSIGIAHTVRKQCTYPSELHESPYSLLYDQLKSCGMQHNNRANTTHHAIGSAHCRFGIWGIGRPSQSSKFNFEVINDHNADMEGKRNRARSGILASPKRW